LKTALSNVACDYILEKIFSFELVGGMKIFEQDIVDKLSISRTPVREAMRRLAVDGILDMAPNKCAIVHTFTPQECFDMGLVRMTIDSLAVQLAILKGSNLDFHKLMMLASECEKYSMAGDIKNRIKYDCDFHTALVEVGGNQELLDIQRRLSLRSRLMQTQQYNKKNVSFCSIDGHIEILNHLMARDAERCIAAVQAHLRNFYSSEDESFTADYNYNAIKTYVKTPIYVI